MSCKHVCVAVAQRKCLAQALALRSAWQGHASSCKCYTRQLHRVALTSASSAALGCEILDPCSLRPHIKRACTHAALLTGSASALSKRFPACSISCMASCDAAEGHKDRARGSVKAFAACMSRIVHKLEKQNQCCLCEVCGACMCLKMHRVMHKASPCLVVAMAAMAMHMQPEMLGPRAA